MLHSILYRWTYGVMKEGNAVRFEVEDLPSPLRDDLSRSLGNKLEKQWLREADASRRRGAGPSLVKSLASTFWKEFIRILLLHAVNDLFIAVGKQLLLGLLLVHLRDANEREDGTRNLIIVAILLIAFYGLNNLLQNHFLSRSAHLGCRIKIALSSLIYRKCLRLGKNAAGENTSAGLVVNLMSNDMRQLDDVIMYLNYCWSGAASTLIILAVMSRFVGVYPAVACLLSVLLAMPVQIFISKSLARNRIKTAYASDKRIQMMDEIICGIQIIKMYAWEKPFEQLIDKLRGIEIKLVRNNLFLRGFQIACSMSLSKFSMYVLIVVYACLGGDIVPEKVFAMVGFCSVIAKVVCGLSFRSFGEVSQSYVSVKRVQRFLELNEFARLKVENEDAEDYGIHLAKVKASWSVDSSRETIKDVTLTVKKGELTTIIGQIGSGKSSILNVMLGELPASSGEVSLGGSPSFYSQVPWIFAGTVRENILFSHAFEASRYARVVEACALRADLESLPHGDHTLVGERGTTLSGGQKARIALARTIYQRADVYLLDDPLSAVDAHIGQQIFEKCVLDFLRDKTRILVTHQLQFLKDSNKIILLHEGRVDTEGDFAEIVASKANHLKRLQRMQTESAGGAVEGHDSSPAPTNEKQNATEVRAFAKSDKKELEREENEKASSNALTKYISNGIGINGFLTVLLLCIFAQMASNGCEIWMTLWTHYAVSEKSNPGRGEGWSIIPKRLSDVEFFALGYTAIIICVVAFVFARNCSVALSAFKCARIIHDMAFAGVIRADSAFFHRNPSGRILNRFSKDLGVVDNALGVSLLDAVSSIFQVTAALLISSVVNAVYLAPAAVVLISLTLLRRFYLRSSVTLKRLENITISPVFVHVHSTLQGLTTIRSHSAEEKLIEQFDRFQDTHTSAWYLYNFTGFGYAYGLEVLCLLYMIAIVTGCFFLDLSGSEVGLALVQVTILLNFAQWSMKQSAEVSNQVTSIDRLLKYCNLPPEPQPEKDSILRENWPSQGKASFCNVSLRYDTNSAASIRDLSFTVQPMEKVGIVGRTGAGKSSLLAALFRLGHVQGTIRIDDVDTSTVFLNKLRSSISVIPQDPVLFSGTVRKNLDPFHEFDDAALWNALEQAELKDTVSKEEAGLDSVVSEGGKNFSVGQRQLICLARAILRNNRVLVLDEATANVDQETDSIIQRTIREKFKSCTVLTIAHRLNTVVDSDKILVMDSGTAVEFDHPYKLLQNPDGYFYKLVSKTGLNVASALTRIAQENYYQQRSHDEIEKRIVG